MGLDINAVRFLIDARKRGADFGEVLTLGRQDLNVYPARMVQVLEAHGFSAEAFKGDAKALYAEPCFLSLSARKVHAMDFSDFEGAGFVHDLNKPVAAELRERFDLVYDGGTLEHVFNFPVALQNCMEMVKPGGHLFFHTGANGYCGHGFYQFSPELFYRALSPENGFEVLRMVLHKVGPYGRWYEVSDPNTVRARVELVSLAPVQLLIQAKRTHVTPIFAQAPQQSDYTPRWQPAKPGDPPPVSYEPPRPALAKVLPGVARLLNVLKSGLGLIRTHTLWNRRSFRPVPKP
jgi:SAM-dependent methyltransferase